ncbi:hypothetical protein THAOC_08948 [Thalassiosira oceanica]|uniref:Uncharacterized protein n=1 Tax=Thalassiosira oceanica TaxID=159749 RepID=K0STR8_THAOC|nr:hypothetical protein THAOC_08948 [Thalassiosira oceanica]|eukprot:EJK69758.1 hypothetical protein THAOC_08948 [Thalassiosira oceanica]
MHTDAEGKEERKHRKSERKEGRHGSGSTRSSDAEMKEEERKRRKSERRESEDVSGPAMDEDGGSDAERERRRKKKKERKERKKSREGGPPGSRSKSGDRSRVALSLPVESDGESCQDDGGGGEGGRPALSRRGYRPKSTRTASIRGDFDVAALASAGVS